jgi:RTA1 like protein
MKGTGKPLNDVDERENESELTGGIVCITLGPAFYSAAIYLTLSQMYVHPSPAPDFEATELTPPHSVVYLGIQYSRLSPAAYYGIFITCDVISLTLQATGGAMSSNSYGRSYQGVDIAIAGLSFQVFTLTVFICLATDYSISYMRGRKAEKATDGQLTRQFKVFVGFLAFAILCILIRCVYRIDELSRGYSGPLIHNQGLFIGLEGV